MKTGETIAVEGVCCAGKTTLIRGLSEQLRAGVIPELPAFGRNLFWPFTTKDSILHNGHLSIELEKVRMIGALGLGKLSKYVILDRSILSTLAVNYGAIDIIGKPAFVELSDAVVSVASETPLVPDKALCLTVDSTTVQKRNQSRIPPLDPYWVDPDRVDRQNDFYSSLTGLDGLAHINGARPSPEVLADSSSFAATEGRLSAPALLSRIRAFTNHI